MHEKSALPRQGGVNICSCPQQPGKPQLLNTARLKGMTQREAQRRAASAQQDEPLHPEGAWASVPAGILSPGQVAPMPCPQPSTSTQGLVLLWSLLLYEALPALRVGPAEWDPGWRGPAGQLRGVLLGPPNAIKMVPSLGPWWVSKGSKQLLLPTGPTSSVEAFLSSSVGSQPPRTSGITGRRMRTQHSEYRVPRGLLATPRASPCPDPCWRCHPLPITATLRG